MADEELIPGESYYAYFRRMLSGEFTEVSRFEEKADSRISLLRHNGSGQRFVLLDLPGDAAVYRSLMSVRCAHLPEIYELAEEDGRLFVLEEFIPGDTLQDLADCSLFPEKKAREITLQICQALYVMHGLGLVHRDVKPSNVVIHGDRAVLIDFSASRFMKTLPDEPSGQEHDTVILGSPGYAAPEQHGLARTDGRADIYSLGVMLNVMITGDHPSRKLAGGRLGRVISRCTMTNPKKRYRDVVHLMEAL